MVMALGKAGTKMNFLAPVRNFHFLYINSTEVTIIASSERNTDPCEHAKRLYSA